MWALFYAHCPFGPRQEEWRAANAAAALVSAWGGKCRADDISPVLRDRDKEFTGFAAWLMARCPALSAIRN